MKTLPRWAIPVIRVYVISAFVAAAVLSPPALAFIPALMAAAYAFVWWRPPALPAHLIADLLAFFAIPILLSQELGTIYAVLPGLPALFLITRDLESTAEAPPPSATGRKRWLTRPGLLLFSLAVLLLAVGVLLGITLMMFLSGVAVVFLGALTAVAFRQVPQHPVRETPVQARVVAGSRADLLVKLETVAPAGSVLALASLYEWLKAEPDAMILAGPETNVRLTFTPPLSGPSAVMLDAVMTDRWGITQTRFQINPLTLHVIPRARYAQWLAERFLTESRSGMRPLISTVSNIRPLYGLRLGVEYYGSQLYQPGDSIKNIDRKRTVKYNKLISKEFAESRGQPAILLVNLAAGDAEELDRQAYDTIVTALSLGREQIPTCIAAYDHDDVRLVTHSLQPQVLVSRCLDLTQQMRTTGKAVSYLATPDVVRLRANVRRLQHTATGSALALARLLEVEYRNLKERAHEHPATRALTMAFERSGMPQSTIVAVSPMTQDAEAIMFIAARYGARGNPVLLV